MVLSEGRGPLVTNLKDPEGQATQHQLCGECEGLGDQLLKAAATLNMEMCKHALR